MPMFELLYGLQIEIFYEFHKIMLACVFNYESFMSKPLNLIVYVVVMMLMCCSLSCALIMLPKRLVECPCE